MNYKKIAKQDPKDVFSQFDTGLQGLSEIEAKSRLLKYGQNILGVEHKTSSITIFIRQFKSVLIYLLLFAATVATLLRDYHDAAIIFTILCINTGLGFYQAYNSEKAINSLTKLVIKDSIVIRDGEELLIDDKKLVPGDVVILKEGDIVPADMKMYDISDLSLNESQLSGESMAVSKSISGEASIVFAGSIVETGEGNGIVFATGLNTQLGKIAELSNKTKKVTQFEKSIQSFSSFLVRITFITLAGVLLLKIIISHDFSNIGSLLLFVVALSIAVVPEAMPVIVTITLSRGAQMLARQHVIARTLTAVEDLGNVTVLCSDKTGTLTENKLRVVELISNDSYLFQTIAAASLEDLDIKRKKMQSSFDKAFLNYIPSSIISESKKFKQLEELPFDPVARRRRVIISNGKITYLVVLGSVETLLGLSKNLDTSKYLKIIKSDGHVGLRHLGIAYKEVKYTTKENFEIMEHEKNLNFLGFVKLEDPLRASTKHTISLAHDLGIKIKILSGDSKEVTGYVASQVGLIGDINDVYTGDQIDALGDGELRDVLREHSAFSRLNPEQKYRIINNLKLSGEVVGYQGDGINDAPALKLADVSIAVNNATDVAKDSADILLLRSNIEVIINGIKYGRGIFVNINKYIRYTMISNFGAFFSLGALFLISSSLPILTIQLIFSNLISSLPLISISTDNVDSNELSSPSLYNSKSLFFISMFLGMYTALFYLIFYALVKNQNIAISQTSLYLFITLTNFLVILCVRNKEFFFKAPALSKTLVLAFGLVMMTVVLVIYLGPTKHIFSFATLPVSSLITILSMCLIYFIFLDIVKVIFYKSKLAIE